MQTYAVVAVCSCDSIWCIVAKCRAVSKEAHQIQSSKCSTIWTAVHHVYAWYWTVLCTQAHMYRNHPCTQARMSHWCTLCAAHTASTWTIQSNKRYTLTDHRCPVYRWWHSTLLCSLQRCWGQWQRPLTAPVHPGCGTWGTPVYCCCRKTALVRQAESPLQTPLTRPVFDSDMHSEQCSMYMHAVYIVRCVIYMFAVSQVHVSECAITLIVVAICYVMEHI
jgi:hypothetical protein